MWTTFEAPCGRRYNIPIMTDAAEKVAVLLVVAVKQAIESNYFEARKIWEKLKIPEDLVLVPGVILCMHLRI